jgi:hypothetical protein
MGNVMESIHGKSITLERPILKENEIYCEECGGVSWYLNNGYLYKCGTCLTGVRKKCPMCGEFLSRGAGTCFGQSCRKVAEKKRYESIVEKAKKLKYDDPEAKKYGMMVSDHYPYNEGYFSEWEDFFDAYEERGDRPKYVFATTEGELCLDAENIVSNACDELHEDAYDRVTDLNELQEFLDKWCEKQTGTKTYYEDNKVVIEIPWHLYSVYETAVACTKEDKEEKENTVFYTIRVKKRHIVNPVQTESGLFYMCLCNNYIYTDPCELAFKSRRDITCKNCYALTKKEEKDGRD